MHHFRLLIVALGLLALTGCRDRHDWHQKLTLVVETPAGDVSGSAVVAVTALFGVIPLTGTEVEYSLRGEATVVEVAPGRYLFALVPGSEERFYAAARDRFRGLQRGEWLFEIPKQTEGVSLLPDHVPMLVTFADVADPGSVMLVDPADLSASFGPGVRLKAVMLGITEEPVTEGRVEAVLGTSFFSVLGSIHKAALDHGIDDPYFDSFLSDIARNDFITGNGK
jgi:hypothetical protein